MTIYMEDLIDIASKSVTDPVGCGNPILASNPESWTPYLRFLYNIVKTFQPEMVVECGVYMAVATMHMAYANRNSLVIGIDNNFHPVARINVAGYDNIRLLHGDSTSVRTLNFVQQAYPTKKIGLLFLDSLHDGITPMAEFILYSEIFADECIVACDDIIGLEDSRQAMYEFFWKNLPGEKMELPYLHPPLNPDYPLASFGVSIVRKKWDLHK